MRTEVQREQHAIYMRQYNKIYSVKNKEKRHAYKLSRRDIAKQVNKQYWQDNKEWFSEWRKNRRLVQSDLIKEQQQRAKKRYRITTKCKENDKLHKACRRRRIRASADGTVTTSLLREMLAVATVCSYCWKSLSGVQKHIDHKNPLSLGGLHSSSNIAICCASCNSKKWALPYSVWIKKLQGADGVNKQ